MLNRLRACYGVVMEGDDAICMGDASGMQDIASSGNAWNLPTIEKAELRHKPTRSWTKSNQVVCLGWVEIQPM
jgi:hypothetical protein